MVTSAVTVETNMVYPVSTATELSAIQDRPCGPQLLGADQ
jgi:hypothetical protein